MQLNIRPSRGNATLAEEAGKTFKRFVRPDPDVKPEAAGKPKYEPHMGTRADMLSDRLKNLKHWRRGGDQAVMGIGGSAVAAGLILWLLQMGGSTPPESYVTEPTPTAVSTPFQSSSPPTISSSASAPSTPTQTTYASPIPIIVTIHTPKPTQTATSTPTATSEPTATATPTSTATPTPTQVPTPTPTPVPITMPTPQVTNPYVDQGDTATLALSVTSGSGGYAYQWFVEMPNTSQFVQANSVCTNPTSSTCTFVTNGSTATGQYYFYAVVTDSQNQTATSATVSVVVTPNLG